MGLFSSLANQVAGSLAAAPGGTATHAGLFDVVGTLLDPNQSGGLQDLAQKFEQQGLGHLLQSWIGNGEKLAITPDEVRAVLGEPHIQAVAEKLGLSPQDVANQLAGLLPQAVDAVSPAGVAPEGNLLSEAFNAFAALRR